MKTQHIKICAKIVLRKKFIAPRSTLAFYLKKLENKEKLNLM